MRRWRLGPLGLDFDREYGIRRRSGWTAVYRGCVIEPQFTTFWRALLALIREVF